MLKSKDFVQTVRGHSFRTTEIFYSTLYKGEKCNRWFQLHSNHNRRIYKPPQVVKVILLYCSYYYFHIELRLYVVGMLIKCKNIFQLVEKIILDSNKDWNSTCTRTSFG